MALSTFGWDLNMARAEMAEGTIMFGSPCEMYGASERAGRRMARAGAGTGRLAATDPDREALTAFMMPEPLPPPTLAPAMSAAIEFGVAKPLMPDEGVGADVAV